MIRVPTTISYNSIRKLKNRYIWLTVFFIILIISGLSTYFIVMNNNKPLKVFKKEDSVSSNIKMIDGEFFRIGTIEDLDTSYIQNILYELGNSLKNDELKNKLRNKKPLFLVGESIEDFKEFDYIKDSDKTGDGRNVIENSIPFADTSRNTGFLSSKDNLNCENKGLGNSNIILHEGLHFIYSLLNGEDTKKISFLYDKYNVENPNYITKGSYQFSNVYEFFTCFADFYLDENSNQYKIKTANSYNNRQIIKEYMPELYIFYENLFGNTERLVKTVCQTKCLFNICPSNY